MRRKVVKMTIFELLEVFRLIQAKKSKLSRHDRDAILDTVKREVEAGRIPPQTEAQKLAVALKMAENLKKLNKFAQQKA